MSRLPWYNRKAGNAAPNAFRFERLPLSPVGVAALFCCPGGGAAPCPPPCEREKSGKIVPLLYHFCSRPPQWFSGVSFCSLFVRWWLHRLFDCSSTVQPIKEYPPAMLPRPFEIAKISVIALPRCPFGIRIEILPPPPPVVNSCRPLFRVSEMWE